MDRCFSSLLTVSLILATRAEKLKAFRMSSELELSLFFSFVFFPVFFLIISHLVRLHRTVGIVRSFCFHFLAGHQRTVNSEEHYTAHPLPCLAVLENIILAVDFLALFAGRC